MKIATVFRLPYAGRVNLDAVARRVWVLTNMERTRHGLAPLQASNQLDAVATLHSRNMASRQFFSHTDPDGLSPQDRLAARYPEILGTTGENIARMPTESDEALARELVAQWMDSPGHRANILMPSFTHLGDGVCIAGSYTFATQLFGALDAILIAPHQPVVVRAPHAVQLRLAWVGRSDKNDVLVWIRCPNDKRRIHFADEEWTVGAFPIEPIWAGNVFAVVFPPRQPIGHYRLHIGSRSQQRYSAASIPVEVTR